ncbi:Phosphatidylinositol (PI) 3-kinase [Savitreella phatthalungensis]
MAEVTFKRRANRTPLTATVRRRQPSPKQATTQKDGSDQHNASNSEEEDLSASGSDTEDKSELAHKVSASTVRGSTGVTSAAFKRRKLDANELRIDNYAGDRSSALLQTDDASTPVSSATIASGEDAERATFEAERSRPGAGKLAGPQRAPTSHLRAITVVDYNPEICKDYKQTGFCGFGDTCKFLHDRGDMKQGWQLDRDWEMARREARSDAPGGKYKGLSKQIEDPAAAEIPFKCVICKDDYRRPIETRCGHFFCEACAVGRYKTTPSCAICGAGTSGIFNAAKRLTRLLALRDQQRDPSTA